MMRHAPRVLAWLAIASVSLVEGAGCARHGTEPYRPEPVGGTAAVIYVYRPGGDVAAGPADVYIDQRHVGRLRAGTYLAAVVDAGAHVVRAGSATDAIRLVELVAGEGAYVELRCGLFGPPRLVRRSQDEGRRRIQTARRAR